MPAPTLTNASCHLHEENLEQKCTLRRKTSEKTSKTIESQPILKVRTVQLPISFIFKIVANKLAPSRAVKSSISLYWCTC